MGIGLPRTRQGQDTHTAREGRQADSCGRDADVSPGSGKAERDRMQRTSVRPHGPVQTRRGLIGRRETAMLRRKKGCTQEDETRPQEENSNGHRRSPEYYTGCLLKQGERGSSILRRGPCSITADD